MSLVLLLEDNIIEQVRLTQLLHQIGFPTVCCVQTIGQAQQAIREAKPDLLIADIFLQQGTSFDFVYELDIPTIFITISPDIDLYESLQNKAKYAYLVKPVEATTLLATITLLLGKPLSEEPLPEKQQDNGFMIRQGKAQHYVFHRNILWLQAEGNYTTLFTQPQKFVIKKSLNRTLDELGADFIRTHKQYGVNAIHVNKILPDAILIDTETIPLSKRFKKSFMKAFSTKIGQATHSPLFHNLINPNTKKKEARPHG